VAKTEPEIREIVSRFAAEVEKLGVKPRTILLFGSYAAGTAREESDIDLVVVSEDFQNMNLRERLELLGLAAGRVYEPIEALGYTEAEIEAERQGTFLEQIMKNHVPVLTTRPT
jgi:predicted nucleotidyltransferase